MAYPVDAELEYRLKQGKRVVEVGHGHTVSLSNNEIVLDSKHRLPSGKDIELTVIWPGPLGAPGRLVLCIQGRILGASGPHTKIEIGRYRFETRPESKPAKTPSKAAKPIGTQHLPHTISVA